MTPQEVLDAANINVKNLGKISQADAISWFRLANNMIPLGAVYGSLDLSVTANERSYSLASATGFVKGLEMVDSYSDPYEHQYRVREVSGVKTLIFEDSPYKTQTVTFYYAKLPSEITGVNFSTLELEIAPDFHDIYQHYLEAMYYKKMLEADLSLTSSQFFQARLAQLRNAVQERWHHGYSRRVRAQYYG